jgi:Protoglobin
MDSCLRPYDQDWLNYQQEIALRHTSVKKNKVDGVRSTPYVPLRDVVAFIAVMNETIKTYLAAKGNSADEVQRMHRAWCESIQLQLALWTLAYIDSKQTSNEWGRPLFQVASSRITSQSSMNCFSQCLCALLGAEGLLSELRAAVDMKSIGRYPAGALRAHESDHVRDVLGLSDALQGLHA